MESTQGIYRISAGLSCSDVSLSQKDSENPEEFKLGLSDSIIDSVYRESTPTALPCLPSENNGLLLVAL
jgi:hypothetical protein